MGVIAFFSSPLEIACCDHGASEAQDYHRSSTFVLSDLINGNGNVEPSREIERAVRYDARAGLVAGYSSP